MDNMKVATEETVKFVVKHTLEEGYVRVPQSRLYRFLWRPIKVKVRSMRERSIGEIIEDNQKVSRGEMRKNSFRYLVYGVAIGSAVTAIIETL